MSELTGFQVSTRSLPERLTLSESMKWGDLTPRTKVGTPLFSAEGGDVGRRVVAVTTS